MLSKDEIGKFMTEFSKLPPARSEQKFSVKCKNCRDLILTDADVIEHRVSQLLTWENILFSHSEGSKSPVCTDGLFINPQPWISHQDEGKINCPKCNQKLGSFKWKGSRCPCSARMTPIFYIMKNRVDITPLSQLPTT